MKFYDRNTTKLSAGLRTYCPYSLNLTPHSDLVFNITGTRGHELGAARSPVYLKYVCMYIQRASARSVMITGPGHHSRNMFRSPATDPPPSADLALLILDRYFVLRHIKLNQATEINTISTEINLQG
jgi:hypothetical protein